MKIKDITLINFSKYDQVTVSLDDKLTYLIGKNGSGKSTLGITAIWFMFQGIAEKASGGNNPLIGERFRFIGPKAPTAKGVMTLIDEQKGIEIKVTRKLMKSGTEVSFEAPAGVELTQQWLTDLFNIFLIAPKRFQELSPREQANALGIDTGPFDKDLAALKLEHTAINREIAGFGKLEEMKEVKEVDTALLSARKEAIRSSLNKAYQDNKAANKATREIWEEKKRKVDEDVKQFNQHITDTLEARRVIVMVRDQIVGLCNKLEELDGLVDYSRLSAVIEGWRPVDQPQIAAELYPAEPTNLTDMPSGYLPAPGELVYIKELPDDKELTDIDLEIFNAGETNKQALLYNQHQAKIASKKAKEAELTDNKKKQADKEAERLTYIKKFKFPFSNLSVGEDGELLLEGKPIKEPYFSTGEILKIVPILISTRNPDLKYVFLQDFNLMDEDKQAEIADYLIGKGFQLVVEMVGKEKLSDKNCILLKDNVVVQDYDRVKEPELKL